VISTSLLVDAVHTHTLTCSPSHTVGAAGCKPTRGGDLPTYHGQLPDTAVQVRVGVLIPTHISFGLNMLISIFVTPVRQPLTCRSRTSPIPPPHARSYTADYKALSTEDLLALYRQNVDRCVVFFSHAHRAQLFSIFFFNRLHTHPRCPSLILARLHIVAVTTLVIANCELAPAVMLCTVCLTL
jgi:hypothetical protein